MCWLGTRGELPIFWWQKFSLSSFLCHFLFSQLKQKIFLSRWKLLYQIFYSENKVFSINSDFNKKFVYNLNLEYLYFHFWFSWYVTLFFLIKQSNLINDILILIFKPVECQIMVFGGLFLLFFLVSL